MRRIEILKKWVHTPEIGDHEAEIALQGWIAVESSMLAAVRFTDRLEVKFTNGSIYAYASVPLELFEDMLKAESIGRYLNSHIKGVFAYKQIESPWTSA